MPRSLTQPPSGASPVILGLVASTFALGWCAMKIYLPTLMVVKESFSTSTMAVKSTILIFFTAFAGSQLVWGVVCQQYGRRKSVVCAFCIVLLGLLLTIFSWDIYSFWLGQGIEALGVGVVSPAARATLFDVSAEKQFARHMSWISAMCSGIPALAQLLGGVITALVGWRGVFISFFALTALYLGIFIKKMPETQKQPDRELTWSKAFTEYLVILKSRNFWRYTLCYMCFTSLLLGYYSAMPFWYTTEFSVPNSVYGALGFFTVAGYVGGLFTARRLVTHTPLEKILSRALLASVVPGGVGILFAICGWHGIPAILLVFVLYAGGAGFVFPTANALVIKSFDKDKASLVSALVATIIFSSTGLFAVALAALNVKTMWALSAVLTAVAVAVNIQYRWVFAPKAPLD